MVKGLDDKMYEEQLREVRLFTCRLEAEGRPHCSTTTSKEVQGSLFSQVTGNRTLGNSLKLCQGSFRLCTRKNLWRGCGIGPDCPVKWWSRHP